jgi:uncharacterized membrane protein
MNNARLPALLYLVMLALGVLHWAQVYPQLPDRMASHFSADGTPNGWQTKQAFFTLMTVVVGLSAFVGFVVPRQIAKKPADKLNLPNKSYWLSPEHREEAFRFFRAQMAWFGCALLFILLYGTSQAIHANFPEGRFNARGMMYVMGGFFLFVIGWIIHFVRHFRAVPRPDLPMPK